MFIDQVKIRVISGRGGNGCISFRREKHVPRGGPDGGDGGNGGDICLRVNNKLDTLVDLRYRSEYKAGNGRPGQSKKKTGRAGNDLVIEVPPGTQVFSSEDKTLIKDLIDHGETYIVVRGGKGGRGNAHFASSTDQSPRRAEEGSAEESKELLLELKLIAEIGIIGLPNAGKSTLLSHITRAHPKVGNYPFTTLHPNLGVYITRESQHIVFADLPGLIEGASRGEGLGHTFLKHIQRTRILLHLIDVSFKEAEDIIHDYTVIRNELEKFDRELTEKKEIIAFNKIDLIQDEIPLEEAEQYFREQDKRVFRLSGYLGEGLEPLIAHSIQIINSKKG